MAQFEWVLRENARYTYKRVHLARMRDISGKFEGGIVTVEDITEQKEMAQQLAQAQKLESIGVLASGIAHEMSTPLQFVEHNLRFLKSAARELTGYRQQSPSEELAADMIMSIKESIDGLGRVSTIVKALKRFAHTNIHDKMSFGVVELVENVVEVAKGEWRQCAEVIIDCSDDVLCGYGIPGEIGQVLLNLVMNSVQAIRQKGSESVGRILIKAFRDGDEVVISIKDTGCGIARDNLHRVFDPFFTTQEPGQGVGQGLNVVHMLVTNNNGTVSVSSIVGEGSTFTVRLPVCSH